MRQRPSRRLRDETPQVRGRFFERTWARIFGATPQKGSGSLWFAKLDVSDGQILWSCKATDAESFRVTKGMMREVMQAIHGPGGIGPDTMPGIAVEVDGEIYCVLRAEDMVRMATENVRYIAPPQDEQKRQRAHTPTLLRDA